MTGVAHCLGTTGIVQRACVGFMVAAVATIVGAVDEGCPTLWCSVDGRAAVQAELEVGSMSLQRRPTSTWCHRMDTGRPFHWHVFVH